MVTLCADKGVLLVWNRYAGFRVGEALGEGTKVTVEQEGDGVVLACLRKRPAAASFAGIRRTCERRNRSG